MKFEITGNGTQGPYRLEGRVRNKHSWGVVATGTFDGATVALRLGFKPERLATSEEFTGPAALMTEFPDVCYVDVVTTGAGGSTDVVLEIG